MDKDKFKEAVRVKGEIDSWQEYLSILLQRSERVRKYAFIEVSVYTAADGEIEVPASQDLIVSCFDKEINRAKNMIRKYELEFERL